MTRPKASIVGLGDAGLSLYNANKLRKMGAEFNSIRRSNEQGTRMTLNAINGIADLQMITMSGIKELQGQLQDLAKISWSIADHFERKEMREEHLGNLKLILINFEEELDKIDEFSEEYPEYATMQVESLQSLVLQNDVKFEHFKTLPPNDMKWAKGILDKIDLTHSALMRKLSDGRD